jgi:hypothetical protein
MDSFPAEVEKFQKYADTQIDLHTRKLVKDGLEVHFFTFKKGSETFALSIDTADRLNLQGPILMTKSLEGSKYQKMGSKSKFRELIEKSELFSTNHLVSELLRQKAEISGLNQTLDEVDGENTHLKADLEEKTENEADLKIRLETANKEANTRGGEIISLSTEILEMKTEILMLRERHSLEVSEMRDSHYIETHTLKDDHERTMGRLVVSFLKSDFPESKSDPNLTLFLESPVKPSPEKKPQKSLAPEAKHLTLDKSGSTMSFSQKHWIVAMSLFFILAYLFTYQFKK